jgi:tetratricopeptide (TPR) repeat protein
MTRVLTLLCLGCVVTIGASAYGMLGTRTRVPQPNDPSHDTPPSPALADSAWADSTWAIALREARRECTLPALDVVVERLQEHVAVNKRDQAAWHFLAEALLERVQQRAHLRGLTAGAPVWSELPGEIVHDVDHGLAAVARARELGDDSGALFRIEAALMSQRITGLRTALQWNTRVATAIDAAMQRAQDDPQLHVVMGLRLLLAPSLLGQDPERALEHFEFAARALADDERPAVFAAMASYLQHKRQQAVAWLEQAIARNPKNSFARVVLQRVRRDEGDPFGRDVSVAEAAASK